MTIGFVAHLCCPICDNSFSSFIVNEEDFMYSEERDTDFHQRTPEKEQPLQHLVHTCTKCGYTDEGKGFSDDQWISDGDKNEIMESLKILTQGKNEFGNPSGSLKFELAARVEWSRNGDQNPESLATYFLRAAWCCMDEEDLEAEWYFRRKAAMMFEEALMKTNCVFPNARAELTYLIGELWRRCGEEILATKWFDRVESEIVDYNNQEFIRLLTDQQKNRPVQWSTPNPP